MIDCRQQIRNELLTVCENVKMTRPEGDVTLPLVCFAMQADEPVDLGVERLRWRIAVYANTFEDLIDLVNDVDGVMSGTLGYTCVAQSPDGDARKGTDFYLKRLDYSVLVDTYAMVAIRGSK